MEMLSVGRGAWIDAYGIPKNVYIYISLFVHEVHILT